jgi:sugar phosphate permease
VPPGGRDYDRSVYAVWIVALLVYLLAVFHRSSLAVAGLTAAERFDISAAQLATFTMLQLLVYAGMQIPVGLLVDRFGPRRVLLTGALTLTLAQAGFAFADSYVLALVARLFVGVGDAMTFICVLRLVNTWFAPRRIPLISQLTGMVGQLGGALAAVPMTIALRELGWTRSC